MLLALLSLLRAAVGRSQTSAYRQPQAVADLMACYGETKLLFPGSACRSHFVSPEHVCSILASLLRNLRGQQRTRLLNKFTENDSEKVSAGPLPAAAKCRLRGLRGRVPPSVCCKYGMGNWECFWCLTCHIPAASWSSCPGQQPALGCVPARALAWACFGLALREQGTREVPVSLVQLFCRGLSSCYSRHSALATLSRMCHLSGVDSGKFFPKY